MKKLRFPFHWPARRHAWRWLTPVVLLLLFLAILLWLPWQVQQMEANERQEQLIADTLWVEQTIRLQFVRDEEAILLTASDITSGSVAEKKLWERMITLLNSNRELYRVVWLDADGGLISSTAETPIALKDFSAASQLAAATARSNRKPRYSQPAPPAGKQGPVLMDYHVPLYIGEQYVGSLIGSYLIANILNEMVPWWFAQENEIRLLDNDENTVAKRAPGGIGRGVYTHQRALDLPGVSLSLRTNSIKTAAKLLPNLLVGSVIALALGLIWSLWALWRDINRRLAAEGALRRQVLFRSAMENSLVTGLRARDLEGRVIYVNPAFCQMVGYSAQQLLGRLPPMPYWAPEVMDEYQQRFAQVLAGSATPQFETVFQRASGERFPALIFEAPLIDDSGQQTGWMGSILDISERKQAEELSRRQQEKLQSSARLATMGEIASTLAHELNQPLAAISSYLTGALNLLASGRVDAGRLKPALEKAGAQAQRAGNIIRSVHTFVKKREASRSMVDMAALIDGLLPLIELQAQPSFVALKVRVAAGLPPMLADPVLLEQVLLNLTRNGIEAMQDSAPARRILRIEAGWSSGSPAQVLVSVIDQGHGIPAEVAERLFSPFFSTKAEGMGMGLNIARSAIEFHGGTLIYLANPNGGTIFRCSLPAILPGAPNPSPAGAQAITHKDS